MRHRLAAALLLALLCAACARRDPTVENLVGTDPQRLSFGPPQEVQASFVNKVNQCWLSGASAPLKGYRFETAERTGGEGGASPAAPYVSLTFINSATGYPAFEVQFHKYNENTLIVTRNISLTNELLSQLKRDIQLWTFNSPDCGNI